VGAPVNRKDRDRLIERTVRETVKYFRIPTVVTEHEVGRIRERVTGTGRPARQWGEYTREEHALFRRVAALIRAGTAKSRNAAYGLIAEEIEDEAVYDWLRRHYPKYLEYLRDPRAKDEV
jgi:hypothetical protein